MNKFTYMFICVYLLCFSILSGTIIQTDTLEDVVPYINSDSLVLFDIDDTLIDSSITLGNGSWRHFIKPLVKGRYSKHHYHVFDLLTYRIAQCVPVKLVEPGTSEWIAHLQHRGIKVLALTSRGRNEWYSSSISGVDVLTQTQLNHVGIHFEYLANICSEFIFNGMLFAGHFKKGEVLKHVFEEVNFFPDHVVFIDDKLDQVQSVESALTDLGIEFTGVWYRRAEKERLNFNPMIANLQMESLFLKGCLIDDAAAGELDCPLCDSAHYFLQVLEQISIDSLEPLEGA